VDEHLAFNGQSAVGFEVLTAGLLQLSPFLPLGMLHSIIW